MLCRLRVLTVRPIIIIYMYVRRGKSQSYQPEDAKIWNASRICEKKKKKKKKLLYTCSSDAAMQE